MFLAAKFVRFNSPKLKNERKIQHHLWMQLIMLLSIKNLFLAFYSLTAQQKIQLDFFNEK